jgi:MoxR-like ATPase
MEDQHTAFQTRIDLTELSDAVAHIRQEVSKIIVGQQKMLDLLIASLLSNGHVLIEGVPGLAKTLSAKLLARTLNTHFSRLQFTPDLMPSDVLGTSVFNTKLQDFEFKKGPIFSNIILIDEINRAPAKTQAALFEVMEERQVTLDGKTYPMAPPFLVIATQNPIEQEGTYRLPEAQLDRFLFKIEIDYPTLDEEVKILEEHHALTLNKELEQAKPVVSAEQLISFQKQVQQIHIEPNLLRYIAQLVNLTRNHGSLYLGASPRASIAIMLGAKAFSAMSGRDYVIPEDIKEIVSPVLKHRIMLTPDKEMEGVKPEDVIQQIVHTVEIPR